ncbi:hypothetical protein IFM89_022221 [Coptis chinensis]|uniref:AP180 N-terminal homology (ANTH) domain-containing protein n=1 Tax=Coptis chinensis TaxID=261450 RepID=A0A835M170_9MAGN|nr:hypothetical protein IFM89_022221 [Coptis chinensis]
MITISKSMGSIVKSLESSLTTGNLQKMSETMDQFQNQFVNMEVQAEFMESSMAGSTSLSTPEGDVNSLMQQVADDYGLEVSVRLSQAAGHAIAAAFKSNEKVDEDDLSRQLAELKARGDEAHSNSWDHSAFVRTYALYLDQKLEGLVYEKKRQGSGGDDRFGGRRDEPYRSGSGSGHDYRFGGRRVEHYRSPPGGYGGGFRDDFGGYGTRPPPRSGSYGDVIEVGRGDEDGECYREDNKSVSAVTKR